jgi:hypothetical protein
MDGVDVKATARCRVGNKNILTKQFSFFVMWNPFQICPQYIDMNIYTN